MSVKVFYNLKVLYGPSVVRATSIYHVCIEMRQGLVQIHHCQWLYHFFINKEIAITTAERFVVVFFSVMRHFENFAQNQTFDLQQR